MAEAADRLRDSWWLRSWVAKVRAEPRSVAKAVRGGQSRGRAAVGGQGSRQPRMWLTNDVVGQWCGWPVV